jgi:TIR domain
MQIFLSYDLRDGDAARVLGARLESDGFTVRHGAADRIWELPVPDRLGSSEAAVVLLSKYSVESVSVNREIDYVLTTKRFKDRLIPVLLDEVTGYPWILEELLPLNAADSLDSVATAVSERLRGVPAA